MTLSSPAFQHNEMIPKKYGRDFENVNPPLAISNIPEGTVSLALTMDDPDIPEFVGVPVWDHWVVFNMPADTREIPEATQPAGTAGKGTRGELIYGGPRPPDKEHRYFFRVYALDTVLDLTEGATKEELLKAMNGHIIEISELIGRFKPEEGKIL